MKKLILTLMMVLTVFAASANSVRYFTRGQANRVANTLDAQNELMIYCGYEYELATYVIVNEVWAERVNSKYYEIWLYGYDAYTGEEIYMPIDLSCIWLYNAFGNRMYSAAQYLRFRSTVATPNFYWTMPPYNAFVRHYHDPHFNHGYTYHYEIHRYGWRPPMHPTGGYWTYHPYYMRTPHTPAPVPTRPFTPGVNYPQTPDGHGYIGGNNRNTAGTRSTAFNNAGGARSGNNMNNAGNPGTTNRNSTANTPTNESRRGAATSGSRSSNTNTGTSSRSSNTNTGTSSRSSNTNTGTSSRSSNTNTGTSSRSSNTNTGTSSRSSNTNTGTSSRSSNTNTGTSSRSSNTNTGTSSRSSNTNTGTSSRSSNVSTGTSSRSSNVSTGTSSRSSNVSTGTSSRSSNVSTGTSSRSSNVSTGTSSRSSNTGTNSRGTSNGTTNRGSRSSR